MQINRTLFSRRRISRYLVTVLGLSLVQTVLPPVLAPTVSTYIAEATTETVTPTSNGSGASITIPARVSTVTIEAVGGGGGKGGNDGNVGTSGTVAGRVIATITVSPGDVLGLYGGRLGDPGVNSASGNGGGPGAADTFPNGLFLINGSNFSNPNFAGGNGGAAGSTGSSGGGGGAGAASIATINSEIVVIAAGAGGGGGAGNGTSVAANWGGTIIENGTNFSGSNGTGLAAANSCPGATNGNGDGGGGGGGGGGYFGGAGGTAPLRTSECAGTAGSPGGNYAVARGTNTTNDRITRTTEGYVRYTLHFDAITTCAKTTSVVDIYTIESITATAQCTWTVPSNVTVLDLFLVGGGGGGGGDGGGGGGGGASLSRTAIAVSSNSTITLKSGHGGIGGAWGNPYNPRAGDSTTVTLATGLTLSALGGGAATTGLSQATGAGGVGGNGGFSGGSGGIGATNTAGNIGGAGKTGTSNYYTSNKIEYGGGGGGGAHVNGSATTAALGASGGGSGGFAASASSNIAGANGVNGLGGGGGGGVAVNAGTGNRVNAGKGGSGVILIRYATNAADSFPAALTSALAGRWLPSDLQTLDTTRKFWIDSTGTYQSVAVTGLPIVTTQAPTDGGFTTGSTKTNLIASGGTADRVTLAAGTLSNYTMLHVARYPRDGGTFGRLITASGGNFISGHYTSGDEQNAHHNVGWMTPTGTASTFTWQLSTDFAQGFRTNGKDVTFNHDNAVVNTATGPTGLGINNFTSEPTAWQMTEIVLFNRKLSAGEMRLMEAYFARIYGLTLDTAAVSSETDTAPSLNGDYFETQYNEYFINDTFTVSFWLKPTASCDGGGNCPIYSLENSLVTRVSGGSFSYALYGTGAYGWQYIDTGVKVKSGQWHHIALTKRGIANTNNSLDVYLDGQLAYTKAGDPFLSSVEPTTFVSSRTVNQSNTWTYIGARSGSTRFYGNIDEVKLWKVARTGAEMATDLHSSDASSHNLQLYYDFNRSQATSSANIPNLAMGGPSRTDMKASALTTYTDVKTVSTSGAHTVVSFPRTYINQNGGWKSPDSVTAASVLVVGGGGGGAGQFSSNTPQSGGGGGGGGVFEIGNYPFVGGSYIPVRVGSGGIGGPPSASQPDAHGRRGGTTSFNTSLTGGGGGGGTFSTFNQMNGGSGTAGGGGGGSTGYWNAFDRGIGGTGSAVTIGSATYAGRTGGNGEIWTGSSSGAGGGAGGNATATAPGPGITSLITGTSTEYGRGGTSEAVTTPAYVSVPIAAGNGGDGYRNANQNSGFGVNGANGQVIVRYITALRPAYTKPVNAFLNVGMTETFTVNTALDSATAGLTRTFRWESSTAGASGPFSTIKQGTGVSNTFFAWVPTDTSTSGSQYLYRLTVTDSDTAGLFITDSSTAFAVINGALRMTGPVTDIRKTINVARSETFTISSGTPGYRYTLTPVIPGITLDTSTVGTTILRISDTATVGTYLETLTVTDSVSASVSIPLSITISAPPQLTNSAEVIAEGQIFTIDPSNSGSYNQSANTFSDISGARNPVTVNNGATFSNDFSGIVSLKSSSSQYLSATGFSQLNRWTIETWIRIDSTLATQFCPLTSEYAPTNISFALCVDANRRFYTGFHNGAWTYKRASEVIPLNTWTHLVGTFDGTNINLYINGVSITVNDSGTSAGTTPPVPSTNRIFLGKSFETAVGTTANVSYGLARLYNSGFTLANVLTNYNATKDRFALANINQLKPSQKYGSLNIETFTVTSGGDTKTLAFAVGNRTGIAWDTSSIPGQVKLTVQESLTPGTYFDTITVTDNFGSSTNLPISFTISKADTITVTAGAATTQVFNGQPATALPVFNISGLVASDTGTVVRRFTGVDWTKTCAQGGGCEVGDTGPGGGTIFYISPTVINVSSGVSTGGRYLEVAPLNWSGLGVESTTAWAKTSTTVAGTLSAIGSGAENTRLINLSLTTNSVAAKVAADLTFGGRSDWFLPSTLEVKEMYDALYLPSLAGNLSVTNYWSSTQGSNTAQADTFWFGDGGLISPTAKTNLFAMRPIRAYSPDTITVTTVPTGADSYTVTAETPTMTIGSLANYQAVIYQSSGLQINKAQQDPLRVDAYGATLGLPYTITILGGSGSGAVIESLTAGSTATGCAISGDVITSTSAGGCNLQIRKAASRNYLADSTTAVVYFLLWVINQPSPPAGSGPNIALSGQSVVTVDLDLAPMISSLSTYAATAGVTSIIITGVGFNDADASFEVKFWRGVIGTGFTVNPAKTQITLTVPVGARSGKVIVVTSKGLATSEFSLEIAP